MAPRKSGLSATHKALIREVIGYIREGDIDTALSVLDHLADNGSYSITMARFQRFWDAYPRKDAQDLARWEWLRQHVSSRKLDRIMAALDLDCLTWQDVDRVPYASTWLQQRRWMRDRPPEEEDAAAAYIRKHEGDTGGGHTEDL
jgi:hypothetical protein